MNSQIAQRAMHQQSSNSLMMDVGTPQQRLLSQTAGKVPDSAVYREKLEENARTTQHFSSLMQHLKKI
jgi:hypothetical protein